MREFAPLVDLPIYYTLFLTKSQVLATNNINTIGSTPKLFSLHFTGFIAQMIYKIINKGSDNGRQHK